VKTQNQRLPEMDSRGILVPADSAMLRYGMRGFTAPVSAQVQYFEF